MHKQLIAFYPEYNAQGNLTKVISMDSLKAKEHCGYDQRQVENVKLALARCYAVDLQAQANIMRSKHGRQIILHFFLPDGRVFLPFKLRVSRVRGDACYGYVNMDYVARLLPAEKPQVILSTGSSLPLFSTISTARLSYFTGWEIWSDFVNVRNDVDLDVVKALAIMREILNGQSSPSPIKSSRRYRVKFLPISR